MVKENIDRERPTQGGKIGRIVGLSRGMRGNKRETRRKKTYAKKTRCLVGLRRKKRSEGNRHQETTRNPINTIDI